MAARGKSKSLVVEKGKFDALLKRMIDAKPAPKKDIKASRKRKLGNRVEKPLCRCGRRSWRRFGFNILEVA